MTLAAGASAADVGTEKLVLEQHLAALHPRSFGWALGCCGGDRDEAAEVLQIAYLKVLDGSARWSGRSTLRTWLFAVIRRTASGRRKLWFLRKLALARVAPCGPVAGIDPHLALEHSERGARIRAALEGLSRRQREVLLLVFYHDLTIQEAAVVLQISLGAARQHYERGKQRLLGLLARGAIG